MDDWNFNKGEHGAAGASSGRQDFLRYLRSIAGELAAVRDRVRQLVTHWPADGHFKEGILRQVLRRHLPESVFIGTGFVVNYFGPSTEVDVLVVDRNMPTLFREGELLIVTPESVRAVIEVKTRLDRPAEMAEVTAKLATQKAHVQRHATCRDVWAGLFVYEGELRSHDRLLEAVQLAGLGGGGQIDGVAHGADAFVKYFAVPENEGGPSPANAWHSFDDPGLAPADFIASLIEFLVPRGRDMGSFAWFSGHTGLRKRMYVLNRPGASPTAFDADG